MKTLFVILTIVSGSLSIPPSLSTSWGKGFKFGFGFQGVHTVTELNLDNYYGRWYEVREGKKERYKINLHNILIGNNI